MFRHLEKMSVEYYNEHKTGDLMTRFTSDLNAIRMAIGPAVICVFDASVMTIMVICQMMYYVNIRLTLFGQSSPCCSSAPGKFTMAKSCTPGSGSARRPFPI